MADQAFKPDSKSLPTRAVTEIYSVGGKDVSVEAHRIDWRAVDEEADVALRCASPPANRQAASDRIGAHSLITGLDWAVYVITNQNSTVSKVGITTNPIKRVEALQCGSHERLRMTHLFWMPRQSACGLERFVLRVAGKLGRKLMGEWTDFDADSLANVIAVLAKEMNITAADSSMFIRNYRTVLMHIDGGEWASTGYANNPFAVLTQHDHGRY